ncbi:hypothetical protein FQN57_005245 [Myotisia sp. PD_48]|nr:hypothetical protein FQN57_005245 [Myotisia sp. PD_48]
MERRVAAVAVSNRRARRLAAEEAAVEEEMAVGDSQASSTEKRAAKAKQQQDRLPDTAFVPEKALRFSKFRSALLPDKVGTLSPSANLDMQHIGTEALVLYDPVRVSQTLAQAGLIGHQNRHGDGGTHPRILDLTPMNPITGSIEDSHSREEQTLDNSNGNQEGYNDVSETETEEHGSNSEDELEEDSNGVVEIEAASF